MGSARRGGGWFLLWAHDHPGPHQVHAEKHGDRQHDHDDRPSYRRPPGRSAPEFLATTNANVMSVVLLRCRNYLFRPCQLLLPVRPSEPATLHGSRTLSVILRWNACEVQLEIVQVFLQASPLAGIASACMHRHEPPRRRRISLPWPRCSGRCRRTQSLPPGVRPCPRASDRTRH